MRQKALIGGVCALTILISVRAAAEDDLQIKLKPVLAEAVQTVKTFKSPEARAILLAKIVRVMARAGMHEEARIHLQLAYQAFQQTEVGDAREQLKPALALAYAEIGSHDKAIELLKPLSLRERVSTYQQIVWSLAERGLFEGALRYARLIPADKHQNERDMAFESIAKAMAERGNAEQARKTAQEIKSASGRTIVLESIADIQQEAGAKDAARATRRSALMDAGAKPDYWDILRAARAGDFENAIAGAERIPELAERVAALAGIAHVYADEANKPEEGRKMLERAFHLALTVPTTDERVQALLYVLEHRNCTQHNELAQRAYQELLKTAGKISSTEERDGVYRMLIDTLIDIGFYEEASQTLQRLSRRSERAFKLAEVAQAEHHCNPESARARLSKAREIVMELIQKRDFRDMFALVGVVRIHVQMGETSLVNPAIQQLWSQIDTLQEVETFTQSKRLNFEGQQVMQLMLAAGKADDVAAWYTKQVEAQKNAELRTQWATQGVEFLVKAGYWEEAQPLLQKIHPPVRRDETLHRLLYALLEESDPESSSDEPWEFRFPLSPEQREKLIEQILNRMQGNRIRAEAQQTLIERLINQKQFEKAWQMAAALSGEHRDIIQHQILSQMISENMHEQAERYVQSRPMRQQIDFWFSVARHNLSQGNRNAAIQALNRITNLISQNSAPEQERFMSWESLAFLQAELGLIEECLKSVRRIEFPEYRADLLIRIAFLLVGDRREARVY